MLAKLYDLEADDSLVDADEELLVLAMQAAADTSFDEIINGIWLTLADQRSTPANALGSDLSWEQVAFAAVAFFHRAYVPCPRPLLEALLATHPDVGANNAIERLAQMEQQQGWRIFQITEPSGYIYRGGTVSTMHARVALRAWALRPAPTWNLTDLLARESLNVPHVARPLIQGLVALRERQADEADRLRDAVLQGWTSNAAANIETRYFAELVAQLHVNGIPVSTEVSSELMRRASLADDQSWLATLELYLETGKDQSNRALPGDLPVASIIDAADFSLAPSRASEFYNAFARRPNEQTRFRQRLWMAFDGHLPWLVESSLLTFLRSCGTRDEVHGRIDDLRVWLREHLDDELRSCVFHRVAPRA